MYGAWIRLQRADLLLTTLCQMSRDADVMEHFNQLTKFTSVASMHKFADADMLPLGRIGYGHAPAPRPNGATPNPTGPARMTRESCRATRYVGYPSVRDT